MNAITFDTLKFARALREKAKLTNEQAEGFAEAITDALHGEIATRGDVEAVKTELKAELRNEITSVRSDLSSLRSDLKATESRLEAKIEAAKSDMTKWMVGSVGFQTLVILGAVIALARLIRP